MDRKGKFWVYIILGLFIPLTAYLLRNLIPREDSPFLIAGMTILILAYLSVMYGDFGGELDIAYREIKGDLGAIKETVDNQAVVRSINESKFYEDFEPNMASADDHVYISYFHNEDPRDSEDTGKVEYYENVGALVQKKSREAVEIKRLIRGIPALEDWIDTLVDEREGTSWYSLGCITDSEPDVVNIPHISVQLVDDDITYFVAVGEQKEETYPRDMFVKSDEMNTQWDRYYHTLWKNSLVIIDRGKVNEENLNDLKEHLEKIQEDG